MADHEIELKIIRDRLQEIEYRLREIETVLNSGKQNNFSLADSLKKDEIQEPVTVKDIELESQIGRFGLAWIGNIVLLVGIIFLIQYTLLRGQQVFSFIFGYTASAAIFLLSEYLKNTNNHLAFMFRINAQLLLYYITLRLHFFSADPLIGNKTIALSLLLLLVCFQFYMSFRKKSQAFAFLAVIFALLTAIFSDSSNFILPLEVIITAASIYFFFRFRWYPLLVITLLLTYFTFFLWLFNNPFAGHPFELISGDDSGIIYLFGLGALFSAVLMLRKNDLVEDDYFSGISILNGILFSLMLFLIVMRFFHSSYVGLFIIISVSCLLYSGLLHRKLNWNFASAFYALYGFMAMSIAVYGLVGIPQAFWLLSLQSLMVVSVALWFRNRLIIVMNSLLFLFFLLIYLFSSRSITEVNFSFAIVALVSARVINWKRMRLEIKTDFLRNLYMIEGFFMMLVALSHSVPNQFVTLSWTMVALLYFLLSIILKNVKYRYMALGTMICTAFYLFIVDLARIELIYRIMALLFLAAISIGISMYYTNRLKHR